MKSLPERIQRRIVISADGCWLWQGWTEKRKPGKLQYAKVWWNGTMRYAHRVVYEILVGPIPSGLQLDHLCSVPWCVNPDHLEPVTAKENTRRGSTGQNMVALTSCWCGTCKICRNREAQRRYKARLQAKKEKRDKIR